MSDDDVLRLAHAELIPWLLQSGLRGRPADEVIGGHCERLVALGVPLKRFTLGHFIINPQFSDAGYMWEAATGEVSRTRLTREEIMSEDVRNSPFYYAMTTSTEFSRFRLADGPCDDFIAIDWLRKILADTIAVNISELCLLR